MAWDERTGKALGNGAAFLRQLRTLKPGQRLGLPLTEFHDMELPVPGSAIYGSTLQEKIDWLCSRAGFPCEAWEQLESRAWTFERKPLTTES
jgi:hypothetical protein